MRWAICLILFPALHASAQDLKVTSGATTSNRLDANPAPDATLSSSATPAASTSTTPSEKEMMNVAAAPMFPDSLMKNYDVEVFQSVLKVADMIKFDYKEEVAKAKTGDIGAMYKLLDFHRIVEGVDALNHAVTCLELIPLMGDASFGSAVYPCHPNMKKILLERLMLAQVRTKKTFMRDSLTHWAPMTWAYLNGQDPSMPATGTSEQKPVSTQLDSGSTPSGKQ